MFYLFHAPFGQKQVQLQDICSAFAVTGQVSNPCPFVCCESWPTPKSQPLHIFLSRFLWYLFFNKAKSNLKTAYWRCTVKIIKFICQVEFDNHNECKSNNRKLNLKPKTEPINCMGSGCGIFFQPINSITDNFNKTFHTFQFHRKIKTIWKYITSKC